MIAENIRRVTSILLDFTQKPLHFKIQTIYARDEIVLEVAENKNNL